MGFYNENDSGGVVSINNLTGSVVLAAGSNVTLVEVGNTITINSSGGLSGSGVVNYYSLWSSSSNIISGILNEDGESIYVGNGFRYSTVDSLLYLTDGSIPSFTVGSETGIVGVKNIDDYYQSLTSQNLSAHPNASIDWTMGNDVTSDMTYYVDYGYASSNGHGSSSRYTSLNKDNLAYQYNANGGWTYLSYTEKGAALDTPFRWGFGNYEESSIYMEMDTSGYLKLKYATANGGVLFTNGSGCIQNDTNNFSYVNNVLKVGSQASTTIYPGALAIFSNVSSSDTENHNIGVVGAGLATYSAGPTPTTGWGVGGYFKGWTNGTTRSAGLIGEGMVNATGDTGASVGVRGYANQTHAGGINIGLYGEAVNGNTNYALFMNSGNIWSTIAQTWTLPSSTSALNINSGAFNFDTLNSRLGLGTTTPGAKLDVFGTGKIVMMGNGTSADAYIDFAGNRSQFGFEAATGLRFQGTSTRPIVFAQGVWGAGELARFAATTGYFGLNTATPNSWLHVNGSYSVAYVAKTANYTATASDSTINCTANTFTVTLPTAASITGRIYTITNSGAGVITIATTSSQTFTNVAGTPTTLTLAAVGVYEVQSDGANWLVI